MDIRGTFDHITMGDAFSHAGIDPRTHVTYALVAKGDEENPAVEFDEEHGQPFVQVTLQPSGLRVRARVSAAVGGNGESDWFPFIENDEVLVVVPHGDERSGCVIIGRLNNSYDKFPRLVAGQDVTKNTFGFRRLRTPYILETASSYMIRSAVTGSFFSIDTAGSLTIADGNSNMMHIGADFVGFGNSDSTVLFQLDLHKNQIIAEAAGTKMILDADASGIATAGTFYISTGGFPTNHVTTTEAVVNIVSNVLKALALAQAGPWLGATIGPTVDVVMASGVALAAIAPLPPPVSAAITAGFSASLPDPLGIQPGLGRAGFMV